MIPVKVNFDLLSGELVVVNTRKKGYLKYWRKAGYVK